MRPGIKRALLSPLLAGLIAGTTLGHAMAANNCLEAAEAEAARLRVVQTELMIAALRCHGRGKFDSRAIYDRFVHDYAPFLTKNARILTVFFERQYGASFEHRQDRFITDVANRVSAASNLDPDFCDTAAALGKSLLASTDGALVEAGLDRPLSFDAIPPICPEVAASRLSED